MKNSYNKIALKRVLKSVLIIESKIGEIRFRQKDYKAADLGLDDVALEKLKESFGVKTPEEFINFIKSLY